MSEPEQPSKEEKGDQRLHRRPAGNERRRASLREFDCCQVSGVCTCAVRASCFDETSEVGVAAADIVKGSKTQTAAGLSRRRSKLSVLRQGKVPYMSYRLNSGSI
jgi:hypothetical protein